VRLFADDPHSDIFAGHSYNSVWRVWRGWLLHTPCGSCATWPIRYFLSLAFPWMANQFAEGFVQHRDRYPERCGKTVRHLPHFLGHLPLEGADRRRTDRHSRSRSSRSRASRARACLASRSRLMVRGRSSARHRRRRFPHADGCVDAAFSL